MLKLRAVCRATIVVLFCTSGVAHGLDPLHHSPGKVKRNSRQDVGFVGSKGHWVTLDPDAAVHAYRKAVRRDAANPETPLLLLCRGEMRSLHDDPDVRTGAPHTRGQPVTRVGDRGPTRGVKRPKRPDALTAAVRCLHGAAQRGLPEAQYLVGSMFAAGEGTPHDDTEALNWYRDAAEQGHAPSQRNVGYMYATGEGVPQDYVQAHEWYDLAASRMSGEERAKALRACRLLSRALTPTQMEQARKPAQEWRPKRRGLG